MSLDAFRVLSKWSGCTNHHNHGQVSFSYAVGYSFGWSACFVGSLYVLVPSHVRRCYDRNHPIQIKWRTYATCTVCVGALISYPFLVGGGGDCNDDPDKRNQTSIILGSWMKHSVKATFGVLCHTATLYLGPLVKGAWELVLLQKQKQEQQGQREKSDTNFVKLWYKTHVEPIVTSVQQSETQRWIAIRNFIVAPMTEEIIFRGCIVSALAAASDITLTISQQSWIAPLFFGLAHVHHAFISYYHSNQPVRLVLLQTMLQMTYTTLFGAYASYAYWTTQSLLAVMVSHSFCNYMGLPDLSFYTSQHHPVHRHKHKTLAIYILGIVGFAVGFQCPFFLPEWKKV